MPIISIVFDVVILAALAATIIYCVRLSRQFNEMQANRRAFESLIQGLNVAIARADATLANIRETAVLNGEALTEKNNRARAMAEELEIMIQAGDSLANRLQTLASTARQAQLDTVIPMDDADDTPLAALQPRTRAEKELLDALKAKAKS